MGADAGAPADDGQPAGPKAIGPAGPVASGRVLDVRDLVAGYGQSQILHGINAHVDEDEIVCVIGPNGAGKSTLIKAIFGLLTIHDGTIRVRGEDLVGSSPQQVVRRGIAYVPQLKNVFGNLTVRENLEIGAYIRGGNPEGLARVYELFPILAERSRQRVGTMSGGQRQMVAMGRALMSNPKLLLLDEPSAGLAPNLVDTVFQAIRAIAESGVPILLVEQNAKQALAIADRGYVLDQGRNRFEGPASALLANPDVGKLYLGG